MTSPSKRRKHIIALNNRLAFLRGKRESLAKNGKREGYLEAEIRCLEYFREEEESLFKIKQEN